MPEGLPPNPDDFGPTTYHSSESLSKQTGVEVTPDAQGAAPESGPPKDMTFEEANAYKKWREGQANLGAGQAMIDQSRAKQAERAEQARADLEAFKERAKTDPSLVTEMPDFTKEG